MFKRKEQNEQENAKSASDKATSPKTYTTAEVQKHNSKKDLWIILDRKVYDMTAYLDNHPGGQVLLLRAGKDVTRGFREVNMHSIAKKTVEEKLKQHFIGVVKDY